MELTQEDCPQDGDDGGCEPSMVSTVYFQLPVHLLNRPFLCKANSQISNSVQELAYTPV